MKYKINFYRMATRGTKKEYEIGNTESKSVETAIQDIKELWGIGNNDLSSIYELIEINKGKITCPKCLGSGRKGNYKCMHCWGTGEAEDIEIKRNKLDLNKYLIDAAE